MLGKAIYFYCIIVQSSITSITSIYSTSGDHVISSCDLRVLRIPLDKMSPAQQQFADTMVTELVTAGVSDLPSLISTEFQLASRVAVELFRSSVAGK